MTMLGAILAVWMVGIPLAVVAATRVAAWRRERTLTRLATGCLPRVPVPLLAVVSLYPRAPRLAHRVRPPFACSLPRSRRTNRWCVSAFGPIRARAGEGRTERF
jgi:hypothetical protein